MSDSIACAVGDTIAGNILCVLAIAGHSRSIGLAIVTLFAVQLWQPFAFNVGLVPEVGEQNKEEGAVHPNEVDEQRDLIVTALHKVILRDMEGN